ncbi:MAG: hypothetical protein HY980_02160 [Candidatus Magasanikbacteria bacterium]|nr:hypothetical protein [Candidatus Magasanikbacteria bacterium]
MSETQEGAAREKESIIEKILSEKRKITFQEARDLGYRFSDYNDEYPGVYRYLLKYGGKILIITIDTVDHDRKITGDDGEVNTFVRNTDDAKHIDEETTMLYTAAQRLIALECIETLKSLLYVLETNNQKMIAWAQTKGRQIFNWDEERVQANDNYVVTGIHCEKLFIPPDEKN